ncbi:hypothetical protein B4U80_07828, partial [Leptotrombidium deliense]
KNEIGDNEIQVLETFSFGLYDIDINKSSEDIEQLHKQVNSLKGAIDGSIFGVAPIDTWNLRDDMYNAVTDEALKVARVTTILKLENNKTGYGIMLPQNERYVVGKTEYIHENEIKVGTRVGVFFIGTNFGRIMKIDRVLPPKTDPILKMMEVEEKPDVTYEDIGGCEKQIELIREVIELPLLDPQRFDRIGIDPPRG